MTITRMPLRASRRSLLLLSGALSLSALSCNKSTPDASAAGPASAAAAKPEAAKPAGPLTVGFIYVGPKDDYGYNQAHAEGAKSLLAKSSV